MKKSALVGLCLVVVLTAAAAQEKAKGESSAAALTIYNQNFFVAREHVPMELKSGLNRIEYAGIAAHLEPDSVILRDPAGRALQILEQNYRNDPVSQELLLSFYEGKTIDFIVLDLVGWITIRNHSGKTFEDARIKLLAGDVNKIQENAIGGALYAAETRAMKDAAAAPVVREKSFDEFHLYTLQRATTLHDEETKQVEFVHASGIGAQRIYVYDGAKMDQYAYYNADQRRQDASYGTQSNSKIWVMEEFKNSEVNHLGIPLPKGKLRFYRSDTDGHLEFIGENTIDHTPKDELIRVYTGNAFDVVGERKRTNYRVDINQHWIDESFEIKVRNHKKEAVSTRIVEHLYRCANWKLVQQSSDSRKGCADRRVSRECGGRWRSGAHVYGALHVVSIAARD